jgi:hypothetical protein
MKKMVFLIFSLLAMIQMNGFSQNRVDSKSLKADTISMDSLEYRLIVLDPGFDSWLATKPGAQFYSKDYYERWNRIYVTEWNLRYMTSRDSIVYDTYIEYDPKTDYGLDLNYRLYYYFKYFEETNHIKLYPSLH